MFWGLPWGGQAPVGNVGSEAPRTHQASCRYPVGSACRPWFRLGKGSLHRLALGGETEAFSQPRPRT